MLTRGAAKAKRAHDDTRRASDERVGRGVFRALANLRLLCAAIVSVLEKVNYPTNVH